MEEVKGVREFVDSKAVEIHMHLTSMFGDEEKMGRIINGSLNLYPIISYYLTKGNDLEVIKKNDFTDPEDIDYCFKCFIEMIFQINMNASFVPNKEMFCQFMGWNTSVYTDILESGTDEAKQIMKVVNDYLVDSQLTAGQSGQMKTSLTQFRTRVAGDNGNGLVTQTDKNADNRAKGRMKNQAELMKDLNRLDNRRK